MLKASTLFWKSVRPSGWEIKLNTLNVEKQAEAPYYLPLADEVEIFFSAYQQKLPVLLKGPTGCGKTRFIEYMAHRLFRGDRSDAERNAVPQPLQTVACHEDLSATDLVGRFLLKGDETVWQDGPLSRSVKDGSICYLDEIVEARKDSTGLFTTFFSASRRNFSRSLGSPGGPTRK